MEARLGREERITALLRERFGIDEIPEGYVLLSSARKARLVSTLPALVGVVALASGMSVRSMRTPGVTG